MAKGVPWAPCLPGCRCCCNHWAICTHKSHSGDALLPSVGYGIVGAPALPLAGLRGPGDPSPWMRRRMACSRFPVPAAGAAPGCPIAIGRSIGIHRSTYTGTGRGLSTYTGTTRSTGIGHQRSTGTGTSLCTCTGTGTGRSMYTTPLAACLPGVPTDGSFRPFAASCDSPRGVPSAPHPHPPPGHSLLGPSPRSGLELRPAGYTGLDSARLPLLRSLPRPTLIGPPLGFSYSALNCNGNGRGIGGGAVRIWLLTAVAGVCACESGVLPS
jgi:hypothetical protein